MLVYLQNQNENKNKPKINIIQSEQVIKSSHLYQHSIFKHYTSQKTQQNLLNSKKTQKQMWNLKCSNRLIDLRSKKQAHQRHVKALRSVKSCVNNSKPKKFTFLQYKAKALLKVKQRNQQIQYHNSILVNRMLTMPSHISEIGDVYTKQSLNSAVLRRRQSSIDNQNKKIVRKLQSTNSKYSQQAMNKSVHLYYKTKSNMALSKMDQFYDFENINVNSQGLISRGEEGATISNMRQKSAMENHEGQDERMGEKYYHDEKDVNFNASYYKKYNQWKQEKQERMNMLLNSKNRKFRPYSAKK